MRKALSRIKDAYINEPLVQDALETALWAGGSAGYQALFTDMSAEDIGKSTALGAVLALAARPVGGLAGRQVGRHIDKMNPNAFNAVKPYVPVTREGSAVMLKAMRKGVGSNDPVSRATRDLLAAKRNLAGPDAGTAEAILSYYLRNRADNVAQAAVALAAPGLLAGETEE